MKKIKIMAICISLIIAFSSLNAEEKKTYVNGTEILASIETSNGIIHVIGDVLLSK